MKYHYPSVIQLAVLLLISNLSFPKTNFLDRYISLNDVSIIFNNNEIPTEKLVEVSNTLALNIDNCPSNITVDSSSDGSGDCGAVVTFTLPTTDLIDGSMSKTDTTGLSSGSFFPVGTTTLEYSELDDTDTPTGQFCTFTVTVNDNEFPTASNPADINVECLGDVPALDPSVVLDEADSCGTPTVAFVSQTADPAVNNGTIIRTYRVYDGNGQYIDVTQNININDITPPTASNPADINIECLGDVPAPDPSVVLDEADNCGAPTVTFVSQTADPPVNDGTIIRTYNVDDGNGQSINVTQNININDITPPTASNPAPVDVQCPANVPAVDISVVTDEADNCTGPITVALLSDVSDGNSNPEIITRTYSVTDLAGNSINVVQNITVNDTTAPDVQCQNTSIALDPSTGNVSISPSDIDFGSDDNCGIVSWDLSVTSFDCSNIGDNIVTLTVEDAAGNSSSCSATVTVTDNSTIASVAIASTTGTTLCSNEDITFNATPYNAGNGVEYTWHTNTGSGFTVVSGPSPDSLLTLNNPVADGTQVKVEITSDSFACPVESNTIALTVNTTVTPSVVIQATDNTICEGESVTFSTIPASTLNMGSNPSFSWQRNSSEVATTSTYTASDLNDGDVIQLVMTPDPSVQCPDPATAISNSISMTVNAPPTIGINASETQICLGDQVTLSGTGAQSYSWDQGVTDGVAFTPTATQTYTVTGTDTNGCQNTASIEIMVNPLPTVTITPSNTTICSGDLVTLNASGATSYSWSSGVTASGVNNEQGEVSPTTTQTYTVTGTDANGCQNTATVTITVNPLPTLSTIDASVCGEGQSSVDLNSLVTTTGTTITFHSSQSDADDDLNPIGALVSPTSPETYYVRSELASGCYVTDIIGISINPLPALTTSDGSVCASGQSSIDLNSLVDNNGGGTLSFYENETDAENGTSAISTTVSPTTLTTYWVRSELGTGCYITASIQISIDDLPTVNAGTDQDICLGTSFDLSTIASGSLDTTLTYHETQSEADNGANSISPNVTPSSTTTYFVRGENSSTGCYNTDSITITIIPDATIALSSGNANQEVCFNEAISQITFNLGGGATGATISGLPAGFSGAYNSGTNTYTIDGSTTTSGTYNYTLNTTGCGTASSSGTITVFPGPPETPTEIIGVTGICPPATETYSISISDPSNVTNINWVVPTGFTITSGQGTEEITVTAGSTASTGNINATLTNPCGSSTVSLPISVDTFAYVNAGTDQYICSNETSVELQGAIGGVVNHKNHFDWSASVNGGSFSYPNGSINGQLNPTYNLPNNTNPGDIITITIYTTGNITNNTCANGGTVIDTMQIFILEDPTATASITGANPVCEGNSSEITFSATASPNKELLLTYNINGGTDETINLTTDGSGNASFVLGTGALTADTTYNLLSIAYAETPTCPQTLPDSLTIAVDLDATISSPTNNNQTICLGDALDDIEFTIGGTITNVSLSGNLPIGIDYDDSNPSLFTISGTANEAGTFSYTVEATGPCELASESGTITVLNTPSASIAISGDSPICEDTSSEITISATAFPNSDIVVTYNINGVTPQTFNATTDGSGDASFIVNTGNLTADTTYNLDSIAYVDSPNCEETLSGSATIIVTPDATITTPSNIDQTICLGAPLDPIVFDVTGDLTNVDATGIPAGLSLVYNNVDSTFTISGTPSDAGDFEYTVQTIGNCVQANTLGSITVLDTPSASISISGDSPICENTSSEITISATAFPNSDITITYDINSGGDQTLSSTTDDSGNASFTIDTGNLTTDTAYNLLSIAYVASPSCEETLSGTATITVTPDATINTPSNIDQTICLGDALDPIEFTVSGDITNVTASGLPSGATQNFDGTSTSTISGTPSVSGDFNYTVNTQGSCEPASISGIITVKEPPVITTQPQNLGVCASEAASFTVIGAGDDLTFQWYSGTAPGGTPITPNSNISITANITSSTLSFGQVSTSNAGSYYVIVSGDGSCTPATSNAFSLNVNQEITITSESTDLEICEGIDAIFSVDAEGTITSYEWYQVGSPDIVLSDGGNISGADTPELTISNSTPSDSGSYYVVISGPGGTCPSISSSIASLSVVPEPMPNISYGTPFCSTDTTSQSVTLTDSNPNYDGSYTGSFSYTVDLGGPNLTLDTNTGDINPDLSDSGTYTITYTTSSETCTNVPPATTAITIIERPTADISYENSNYCKTDSTTYSPSFENTAGVWDNGSFSYVATVGGPNLVIDENGTITPSDSNIGTYTVTYTIDADVCPAYASSFEVTIDPLPVATFSYNDNEYCLSQPTNPTPIFSGGGVVGTFSYSPIGLSINPSTGIIDLEASGAGIYTITNTIAASDGCEEVSHSFTLTLYEEASGGTLTGTAIGPNGEVNDVSTVLICQSSGGTLNLSSQTGSIVGWEYSNNGGLDWYPILEEGNLITSSSYNFSEIIDTTIYRVIIENGPCGQVYSTTAVVSVVPNDLKPNPVTVSAYTLCLGDPSTLSAESSIANGQFITKGNFNTGQLNTQDPDGFLVDGNPGGWTASGDDIKLPTNWSGTNDHPFPVIGHLDSGELKFGIVGGPVTSTLETPIFNTFGLEDAIFEFIQAYNIYAGDQILVELSLDGGANYTEVLQNISGPASSGNYNPFNVNEVAFDLEEYNGLPNLRIKFTYTGTSTNGLWAIDGLTFPSPPIEDVLIWSAVPGTVISYENSVTVIPPTPGVHTYAVTSYLVDSCGYEVTSDNSEFVDLIVYDTDTANAGPDITISQAECGLNTVTLAAEQLTGVTPIPDPDNLEETINLVSTGEWSVTSGQDPSTYSFADPSAYNTTFTGDEEGPYTLTWTVTPAEGSPCSPSSDTMIVTLTNCSTLDFDGVDDNVTFRNYYDFSGPFSIELWLKSEAFNSSVQTIISKRDATNMVHGYDLRLVNNMLSFNWNSGGSLTASDPIGTDRWYHLAVTFNGTTYNLYVDGILVGAATGSTPINNNFECILGAMDQAASGGTPNPVNYFTGWMDELRIWNTALTVEQIRFMMNQEVENIGGNIRGSVVPIDAPGLTWANFIGYYQMNQTVDIVGGYIIPNAGTQDGRMRNITTWQEENAPLPYTSDNNGNWMDTSASSPWLWGHSVWDYPNSKGINGDPIDWNIVITSHDIVYNPDDVELQLLGLLVNSNELTITDSNVTQDENNPGNGLIISHYLKLDGVIDLIGESQLVQKRYTPSQLSESILDPNSSGFMERDQQGTYNLYNYNYWSSPVSPINSGLNSDYSVGEVLLDGTDSANPKTITWTSERDASPTSPITMSSRWIYKFNGAANTYSIWSRVGNTGNIETGIGYTMKGSGTSNGYQNYVFKGIPHNGLIENPLAANDEIFLGNPYPSAMDVEEFIKDNIPGPNANPGSSNAIDGTLQFWIHYNTNDSHNLEEYEGGFALYNLLDEGVPPISSQYVTTDGFWISGLGSSDLKPGLFIPVGQGFVSTAVEEGMGGNVKFENDQRFFKREANPNESIFLRQANSQEQQSQNSSSLPKKILLGAKTPEGSLRTLLLGFVTDAIVTDGYDYGYDARNRDSYPSDISWSINEEPFVIQGVGEFDSSKQYPFIVKIATAGTIEISLMELKNFQEDIDVYIYDSLLGTYSQINNISFQTILNEGEYIDRFYITFQDSNALSLEELNKEKIMINYFNSTHDIYIKTSENIKVKQVYLINTIGQTVKAWNMTNTPKMSNELRIPVSKISEGSYLVKLVTEQGSYNKKLIINY
ncbi:LamG-like jellyroll fold domain-containing protein [Mangrovimonas sp. DI 80]|uniref:LamG-like jellyroll fold domain-containing protein n=1 Tax=Mangrovimonas sp. DI 80 TaxID=1779330 RepID=UPI000F50A63C|nr:LamG-like jellyroll fold domain-containing protein [Mangrovimonas sp. DI 80]